MPKIIDREERREEIALAALNLFAEEGFAVPVSRIARAAGLSKGSLYVYFESRGDIILATLEQWASELTCYPTEELEAIEDVAELFLRYCHIAANNFVNDPRAMKILAALMHLWLTNKQLLEDEYIFPEYMESFRSEAVSIINEGAATGAFRSDAGEIARKLAVNLYAYMDGLALHYWFTQNFDLAEQLDFFVEQTVAVLTSIPWQGDNS